MWDGAARAPKCAREGAGIGCRSERHRAWALGVHAPSPHACLRCSTPSILHKCDTRSYRALPCRRYRCRCRHSCCVIQGWSETPSSNAFKLHKTQCNRNPQRDSRAALAPTARMRDGETIPTCPCGHWRYRPRIRRWVGRIPPPLPSPIYLDRVIPVISLSKSCKVVSARLLLRRSSVAPCALRCGPMPHSKAGTLLLLALCASVQYIFVSAQVTKGGSHRRTSARSGPGELPDRSK